MVAFPSMLEGPAKEAGMKVPADPEGGYIYAEFPHFTVLVNFQTGRPMPTPTAHWDNAKVIAKIPHDEIMKVTFDDLIERGCV